MRNRPRVNERESKQYAADPAMLRAIGVVALLAIGTIHFLQIVPTVQETPLLGVAYVGLIGASVIIAAWLAVANDARAWAAAGLISAAVLVGYAVGAVTALLIIRSSQEELVATGEPAA